VPNSYIILEISSIQPKKRITQNEPKLQSRFWNVEEIWKFPILTVAGGYGILSNILNSQANLSAITDNTQKVKDSLHEWKQRAEVKY